MESTPRPGDGRRLSSLTRRAFFLALLAPFLAKLRRWLPTPAPAIGPVTSLTTTEYTGATLRLGDTFSIPGYNAVNPITLKPTAELKRFVVTARVTAVDGRCRSITFMPAAVERGPYQNVARVA